MVKEKSASADRTEAVCSSEAQNTARPGVREPLSPTGKMSR
ncbi:MAG: hypothetical protein PHD11_08995 [Bacteroidales bacterium]|nr:hypothetical protein [Bacteroidales bacterium]